MSYNYSKYIYKKYYIISEYLEKGSSQIFKNDFYESFPTINVQRVYCVAYA